MKVLFWYNRIIPSLPTLEDLMGGSASLPFIIQTPLHWTFKSKSILELSISGSGSRVGREDCANLMRLVVQVFGLKKESSTSSTLLCPTSCSFYWGENFMTRGGRGSEKKGKHFLPSLGAENCVLLGHFRSTYLSSCLVHGFEVPFTMKTLKISPFLWKKVLWNCCVLQNFS